MAGNLTSVLLSWPLLLSLATLVANDFIFKYQFPGLLTGKLSDFAGIFLVSSIAFAVAPRRRWQSAVAIVLLFAWWKSPYSQSFIGALNALSPIQFNRVVDPWDLLAFSVMPLALLLARKHAAYPQPARGRAAAAVLVAITALCATAATSVYLPSRAFQLQNPDADSNLDQAQLAARVERVANDYGAACTAEDLKLPNLYCAGKDLQLLYFFDEATGTAQIQVTIYRDAGFLFAKPDQHLLQDVLSTLKADFERMEPDVIYVEASEEDSYSQVAEFIERICGEDSYCEKE